MNVFLEEMSEYLGTKEAFIVMDCARWHRSKNLKIPQNITPIYLPPYSPELNPVERLWQYIKDHTLKNKVYDNLEILEDIICTFINEIDPSTIRSICKINYLSCYL